MFKNISKITLTVAFCFFSLEIRGHAFETIEYFNNDQLNPSSAWLNTHNIQRISISESRAFSQNEADQICKSSGKILPTASQHTLFSNKKIAVTKITDVNQHDDIEKSLMWTQEGLSMTVHSQNVFTQANIHFIQKYLGVAHSLSSSEGAATHELSIPEQTQIDVTSLTTFQQFGLLKRTLFMKELTQEALSYTETLSRIESGLPVLCIELLEPLSPPSRHTPLIVATADEEEDDTELTNIARTTIVRSPSIPIPSPGRSSSQGGRRSVSLSPHPRTPSPYPFSR